MNRVISSTTIRLFALAAIFAGLPACAAEPAPAKLTPAPATASLPALEGTHWKLTQLNGQAPLAGTNQQAYIQLDAGAQRVSGTGGCNRLMGGYTSAGETISFTQLAGTKMACPVGMEQDDAMSAALTKAKSFKISGDTLTLSDENGATLATFQAAAEPAK